MQSSRSFGVRLRFKLDLNLQILRVNIFYVQLILLHAKHIFKERSPICHGKYFYKITFQEMALSDLADVKKFMRKDKTASAVNEIKRGYIRIKRHIEEYCIV